MVRRMWSVALLAGAIFALVGCEAPPGGAITKDRAEKELAERLDYTDVKLEDQGGGRFAGTAKDDRGELADVEVTYAQKTVSWKTSFKSADGRITRTSSGSTGR